MRRTTGLRGKAERAVVALSREKKQDERQVLSMQKALLKRKGKNCSLCRWPIRGKIMDLNFIRGHCGLTLRKHFNIQDN